MMYMVHTYYTDTGSWTGPSSYGHEYYTFDNINRAVAFAETFLRDGHDKCAIIYEKDDGANYMNPIMKSNRFGEMEEIR